MKCDSNNQVYYPLFVNLKGRRVVVVGGGNVAERKVKGLLGTGALITVISPEVTDGLGKLASSGEVIHIDSAFNPEELEGAWLVIAATDDPEVQRLVYKEATRRNIFCNTVDQPELCSFIVPSIVRRGDLSIAISTGGKSPALARRLRQELETVYGKTYSVYVSLLGALRGLIVGNIPDASERKRLCQALAAPEVADWIEKGLWKKVADWAVSLCGEEAKKIVSRFEKASK